MLKIQGKITGELEIKRFCMDGLVIQKECPKCGHTEEYDQYLSYPVINKQFEMDLYCDECEHEWTLSAKLEMNLVVSDKQ